MSPLASSSANFSFVIRQPRVCRSAKFARVELRAFRTAISSPDDFIPEILCAEDAVENEAEIMAGGGVAMEVERAGGFEDAVEFDEARRV